jgi:hypothetical protein
MEKSGNFKFFFYILYFNPVILLQPIVSIREIGEGGAAYFKFNKI